MNLFALKSKLILNQKTTRTNHNCPVIGYGDYIYIGARPDIKFKKVICFKCMCYKKKLCPFTFIHL
ncbi:hypothetical protein KUTeg_009112 [Tegillarca granosa]|uniref:Uncharacterized protein n=1 Tax=Tegillarca granosa TaxID=220873 RepID=A0ABQ9F7G6_TEGGR|nr:hypothetical protein KUTeg_009112 [Tegillarca granosa]